LDLRGPELIIFSSPVLYDTFFSNNVSKISPFSNSSLREMGTGPIYAVKKFTAVEDAYKPKITL